MAKNNKVAKRINKYYGPGTWDKLKDLDKSIFVKDGAYKLYTLKRDNLLPDLDKIGALK